ncbi:hypothetical protein FQN55_003077 [Onygenales sp. PD_40]|nr:hypothetical protein FQN55_003077 [Onygenales sp. PD_40]KAK2789822.1 hypothetical protein FQN51_002654 [Onygenales sp. PD_10]
MALETDKNEMKWEDSPGHYHGCGVCGTRLNSPKAKKTCYGTHTEPCSGHKCDPCGKSNLQHEKRHKEIAVMVGELKELVEGGSISTCNLEPATKKVMLRGLSENPATDRQDETEVGSSSSVGDMDGPKPVPKTPAIRRHLKQDTEIHRIAKNRCKRSKFTIANGVVPWRELEKVDNAIHGTLKLRPAMVPEEAFAVLVDTIELFQRLKSELERITIPRKKKGDSPCPGEIELEYIQNIMAELGVPPPYTGKMSRSRKALLAKLAVSIFQDIEMTANESRETVRRKLSYWSFVSKKTYNAMVRNNQLVNWETGEKLAEEDLDSEEPEDGSGD